MKIRGEEWLKVKADRKNIGGGDNLLSSDFVCHELDVVKGDQLYMLSDGFVDQFGGGEDKKYMIARFRDFIFSIKDLDMEEQRIKVEEEFYRWKGSGSQIDDVLVMGVRV